MRVGSYSDVIYEASPTGRTERKKLERRTSKCGTQCGTDFQADI
jgi:hypothetical protein